MKLLTPSSLGSNFTGSYKKRVIEWTDVELNFRPCLKKYFCLNKFNTSLPMAEYYFPYLIQVLWYIYLFATY